MANDTRVWIVAVVLMICGTAGCESGTNLGVEDADPEFVVNLHDEGDQMNPVVVAQPSGQFLVVWESGCLPPCVAQDGNELGVYGRRYTPSGEPLGGEFRVNDQVDFNQAQPSAAILPDGRFVIAWATEGGITTDEFDVRLKIYGSEGVALTSEIAVNEETAANQWRPRVSLTSDGVALVIWEHHEPGGGSSIMGRRFASDGSPRSVSAPISGEWGSAVEPGLAGLPDGRAVAVWSGGGILAQRLRDGEPVGSPAEVSTGVPATYPMPSVAISPDGDFVVVWSGSTGEQWGGYDIAARAFSADASALTGEIAVNADASGLQMAASAAISLDGDQFVVAWESELDNGTNNEIIAKVYGLDGAVIESDFVVNSYQAQMQDAPSATPTLEGFLIGWQSTPETGDGYNVYVRLFPTWP